MARTALITGASSGLGLELAKLFAADGYALVLVARRGDRLEALADELARAHETAARVLVEDLADPTAVPRLHAALLAEDLHVDALVNNAGFGQNGRFAELDLARQLAMVQVNVTAVIHLTRLLLPGMLARGHGRILNLGSIAGFVPGPFMATYYASKAFINSFTEALNAELHGTGVTATVSCPGPTRTEFDEVAGRRKPAHAHKRAADAASVAREAYEAMCNGRAVTMHGFSNRLAATAARFGPRKAVLEVVSKRNRPA